MQLNFTLDSQKSIQLKQQEYFTIGNISEMGTITLQKLRRGSIEDIYIIKDEFVSGIQLVEEINNTVGDYTFLDDNKLVLLQGSSKLRNLENFSIVVTSKNSSNTDKYLFEEDSGGQNIINSTIGDEFATVIQKVYITQEDYNYKRVIINQMDLSPYYGLRTDYFKFQYYSENIGDNVEDLIWYNSISIDQVQKNTTISIWVKVTLPKLGLTTINRDINLQYSQQEC